MDFVYDVNEGKFREAAGKGKGKSGTFLNKEEVARRLKEAGAEARLAVNNWVVDFLTQQIDSPYKLDIGKVTGLLRGLLDGLGKGAGAFAGSKFCVAALKSFVNAKSKEDCENARKSPNAQKCIADIEAGASEAGAPSAIYMSQLAEKLLDKFNEDCCKARQ